VKILIHMKSGKTITQSGVKNYSFTYSGDDIKSIEIELYWFSKRTMLVPCLRFSSIEAVEVK
jgi:hypothetical protein